MATTDRSTPIFTVLDDSVQRSLSGREQRLLHGAISFYALVQPGRTFRWTVLRGATGEPALTDKNRGRIEWEDDRQVVGVIVARSLMHTALRETSPDDIVDLTIDLGGEQT